LGVVITDIAKVFMFASAVPQELFLGHHLDFVRDGLARAKVYWFVCAIFGVSFQVLVEKIEAAMRALDLDTCAHCFDCSIANVLRIVHRAGRTRGPAQAV